MSENLFYYGPTDCMMNVAINYLHQNKKKVDPIYTYNFDMRCIFENKRLSGSISIISLFEYMRKHFGIDRKEIRIDDIFDHEYIIACLDLYNIKNNVYYQKHHAGHYMLVKIVNKLEVEIYEPHMDIKEVLSFNGFIGNLFDNETFYTFVNTETSDHVFDFIHKPYILNSDYIDKYKHVTEDMKRLMEWAYEHMEDPYTFQKIFGMLRSTFLARENYFKATAANEEQVTNILNGWKKAQVNYRKMMANRKYLYETIQTIERVFEEEMVYLGSI